MAQADRGSKAGRALPIAAILAAIALSASAAGAAEKVAVVPIENDAALTAEEIGLLTNAAVSAFTAPGAQFEVVVIEMKPGESCSRLCVFNRVKSTGARYLVTGAAACSA